MTSSPGFPRHEHPLVERVSNCTICAAHLPREPKPIFHVHPKARIALLSQAPGRLAHDSGIAWDDPSGRRLRDWLGVTEETFYAAANFAVVPMGFCYPGKGKGGDLPPRPECAPQWHQPLLDMMPHIELKILIGAHAQKHFLGAAKAPTLTETVRNYERYLPEFFVLPHPSPRNQIFLRKNPWIEVTVVPHLRSIIGGILSRSVPKG